MNEPLLFPIKRAGQPEIHLARLLREFFEIDGGNCLFYEFKGSVRNRGHLASGRTVPNIPAERAGPISNNAFEMK